MEVLIELIGEILFEGLAELFFFIIGKVFYIVDTDRRKLKATKIIIYTIITLLLLALLIVSLIYKKNVFVILTVSYFLFLAIAYYFIYFFDKVVAKTKAALAIRWIVRILKYPYAILLIILATKYLTDQTAKTLLITGASLGLAIYVFIDAFRIYRYTVIK